MALSDTSFTYSTVQTGYLMIGPGDLVPESNLGADDYYIDSSSASSTTSACFRAVVHLPHGARMTSVRTSYFSGTESDLLLNLIRRNPVTGSGDVVLPSQVVTNDSGMRTYVNHAIAGNLGLINNALFTYTYMVCVGPGTYFNGTRITYQYTSAGD